MSNYGMSFSPLGGGGSSDEELLELLSRMASGGRVDIGRLPAPQVRGGVPLFDSLLSGGQGSPRPSLSEVLAPSEPLMAQQPMPADIPSLEDTFDEGFGAGPMAPEAMPVEDPAAPPAGPGAEPFEQSPDPGIDPGNPPVNRPGDIYEAGIFPEEEDELFASLMQGQPV